MYNTQYEVMYVLQFSILMTSTTLKDVLSNTIVLINGCFHNVPVMCPRSVIMVQGICIGPNDNFYSNSILQ